MTMAKTPRGSLVPQGVRSAWTPVLDKTKSNKLFNERVDLVSHWFDLWTDKHRKAFLLAIFKKCSRKQLKFVVEYSQSGIHAFHHDFTLLLPRSLSLRIFSLLDPKSLCRCASVCWRWRYLSEEDAVWSTKCSRLGWYLPYEPQRRERAAWKNHYVGCSSNLDVSGLQGAPKPVVTSYGRGMALTKATQVAARRSKNDVTAVAKPRASDQLRLVLISSRTPGAEFLLNAVSVGIPAIIYDFDEVTLPGLLNKVQAELQGRLATSVAMVVDGLPGELDVCRHGNTSLSTFQKPEVREFWEKLSQHLTPSSGHVDLFTPLGSTEGGMDLIVQLSMLTGNQFNSPINTHCGLVDCLFGDWLIMLDTSSPIHIYFNTEKLLLWRAIATRISYVLHRIRSNLSLFLRDSEKDLLRYLSGVILYRELGEYDISKAVDNVFSRVVNAMAEFCSDKENRHDKDVVRFVARKLLHSGDEDVNIKEISQNHGKSESIIDMRATVASSILTSEEEYLNTLSIIFEEYTRPIQLSQESNRPILDETNSHLILGDITVLYKLSQELFKDLDGRVTKWSVQQNLGDVFLKFSLNFKAYINFINTYQLILETIKRCIREKPRFRSFMVRNDAKLDTKMQTLPELLLAPIRRVDEYLHLLNSLYQHTRPDHSDRDYLKQAVNKLKALKLYISNIEISLSREQLLRGVQSKVSGCPKLVEANRFVIIESIVSRCVPKGKGKVKKDLQQLEHTDDFALILFNDALLIADTFETYVPFQPATERHFEFRVCIPMAALKVVPLDDTVTLSNAFWVRGGKEDYLCFGDSREEKVEFVEAAQGAKRAYVKPE